MCRCDARMGRALRPLICLLVSLLLTGGCAGNALRNPADNLTVVLRCSTPCALDFVIEEGHLKARVEDIVKDNCSLQAGDGRITVACPADLSHWPAALGQLRGYPARQNATS